jgi:hypothetical protein
MKCPMSEKTASLDCNQDIRNPAYGRAVILEARSDLGERVSLAPDRVNEDRVQVGQMAVEPDIPAGNRLCSFAMSSPLITQSSGLGWAVAP